MDAKQPWYYSKAIWICYISESVNEKSASQLSFHTILEKVQGLQEAKFLQFLKED